ncbi:S41 family peptidase [Kaistella polysaccharea]|uniref:S41 family peptidase n=1 Tax=Kaistella polysaccharea TaxID=2878534 RepID=UPI001CF19C8D|nr:S41 family peptidase [Kaistella polysaccharea]
MNLKKYILVFAAAAVVSSCSRDDAPAPGPKPEPVVTPVRANDFVWKGLNSWYYWQKNVPTLGDNYFKTPSEYASFVNAKKPDDLFYSLLYDYPNKDRFSWIVPDYKELIAQFNGVSKSSGMDISLYLKNSGNVDVVAIINYIVPNSPAAAAGLKRGDVISAVNGAPMTVNNYTALFSDQFSVTVAQSVSATSAGIVTSGVAKTATVNAVVLEENPVAYYETKKIGGKNIGYLVYNGFQSNYNDELNAAFGKMKQDNVTDLILDLRYNGGGSVETAVALGQMVTGQFTGSPYVILDFNEKHKQYSETDNLATTVNTYSYTSTGTQNTGPVNINSLNLNRVYVLTSSGSASASELTIQGLKAYINVTTIGAETYGKFVGSITLYDSPTSDFLDVNSRNMTHTWAMQPITFSYYNGKRQENPISGGIAPNYAFAPADYFGKLKEFGDASGDVALAKALELITGQSAGTNKMINLNGPKLKFLGTNSTLTPFGSELYLEHPGKNLKK